MAEFNVTTYFILDSCLPEYKLVAEACPEGGSAICRNDWLYVNWLLDWPDLSTEHINIKAARHWHSEWKNACVNMLTDNKVTMYALKNNYIRSGIAYNIISVTLSQL